MKVLGIIIAIIAFMVMIIAHEFGHFSIAKMMGIMVEEFSLGMGPLLWQKKKGETVYSFRAIPLGGYCAFEDDKLEEKKKAGELIDESRLFSVQPWWSKVLVLLCGPFMNIIIGLLLLFIVFVIANPGVGLSLCFKASLKASAIVLQSVVQFIQSIFNGTVNGEDISGIVGIVGTVGEAAQFGLINVFYLIAIISVNLGYMNLLPVPALDGGRILLILIRKISGDRIPESVENAINGIGMLLLFGLMIIILFKDMGLFR